MSRSGLYIISSNSACWTYFFALTAANTLRMVGRFGRINLHLADLCAGAALGTLIFIYPVFEHGNRIKNRIDGAQRTDIFAERAVDDHGQKNGNGKQYVLPGIQPAKYVLHGPVQQNQRDAALQRPNRADKLAEVGRALPQNIHQKQGKQNDKDRQIDVF